VQHYLDYYFGALLTGLRAKQRNQSILVTVAQRKNSMYNMQSKTLKFDFKLNTDGKGYWSDAIKEVTVTKIELEYDLNEPEHGELCVYFDTETWNVAEVGLIYTDKQFMDELRGALEVTGLNDEDISYSEQGMQGNDYISLDVGKKFIESWSFNEWAKSELPGK